MLADPKGEIGPYLAKNASYADTKGDVMLELILERSGPSSCVLELRTREKPIYRHLDGKEVNIAEHSGIIIPEREELGQIEAFEFKEGLESPEMLNYNREFIVDRDGLVLALHNLFTRIREYERQQITYEQAFNGHGIDRPAQVSITGMGVLRGFDSQKLKDSPDVYHTLDDDSEVIVLPPLSSGYVISVPRIDDIV